MHYLFFPLLLVNECKTNNGGCEEKCVDTLKSYTCLCSTGYALSNDGHSCEGKIKHKDCYFMRYKIWYDSFLISYFDPPTFLFFPFST